MSAGSNRKPLDIEMFHRLWGDPNLSAKQVARKLGMGQRTLHRKVRTLGLPNRRSIGVRQNTERTVMLTESQFAAEWFTDQTVYDLKVKTNISFSTMYELIRRFEFPMRRKLYPQYKETVNRLWVNSDVSLEQMAMRLETTPKGAMCLVGWHQLYFEGADTERTEA